MNGQDQPLNQGTPTPAAFGAPGFGGEATTPAVSGWNPETIPTPGPIENQSSTPEIPAPGPTPLAASPAPVGLPAAGPIPTGMTPTPSPAPMPATPITPAAPAPMEPTPSPFIAPTVAAPTPITPSFAPAPEARSAFDAPSLMTPSPSAPVEPAPSSVPPPPSAPVAPQQIAETPTIAPRSFEIPTAPVAPVTPPTFAAPVGSIPVPPPPPTTSTIDLRTMASDVSSLQATGGAEAVPQSFTPETFTADASAVFSPTEAAAAEAEKPKGKTGKIILISGLVVLAFALGAGIYFFFIGRGGAPAPVAPEEVAPPAAEMPAAEVPPPAIPPAEAIPEGEQQPTASEEPSRPHSSFFSVAADTVEQKVVPTASLEEFKKAFYSLEEGASAPADGFIKEVVLTKSGAGFVNFPEFLNVFLPELSSSSLAALFNDDFTTFVYQDRTNPMMGFIASTKTDATPEAVAAFTSSFEASKNVGNFYATDPGAPATSWKGGFVSGKPVQYLAFPKVGYAFDYGWFKDDNGRNYLVVSASYAGMREAVRRAGL